MNTEIFFFGHDVTSHLIKHSFMLLSRYCSALLFVLSLLDRQKFIWHLAPKSWMVCRCILQRISYLTMFLETAWLFCDFWHKSDWKESSYPFCKKVPSSYNYITSDCQIVKVSWISLLRADPALPHTDFPKKERECTWSLLGYFISLIL